MTVWMGHAPDQANSSTLGADLFARAYTQASGLFRQRIFADIPIAVGFEIPPTARWMMKEGFDRFRTGNSYVTITH